MAKKVSENDIHDMTQDWGLDSSNNLPYSGAAVQKFIKEKINSKIGYFHYDSGSNRYLCFADEASKNQYLDNPTLTDLVLGAFDAPFNYEASITLISPSYNAVFLNSTGNYIDFTFDITNKEGNSTGENVNVSYTFIRNSSKKVFKETRKYGETVHFQIDEFLLEGTNTIIVGIAGQNTLAATTAAITYQVVNLSFSDSLDISKVYNLSSGTSSLEIPFSVSGYGTKTIEWFLDGEKLDFVKNEDEVVDVSSQRTKYIQLTSLSSGVHTIQSRAYTIINGERFYTDILYREIMVNNGETSANMVALAVSVPESHGIVTESNRLVLYGVEQYIPYSIRFATAKTGEVSIYLGEKLMATVISSAGVENEYGITSNEPGSFALRFSAEGADRELQTEINGTALGIEEITGSLELDFKASGKSNNSVDKDVWSYGNHSGTFDGFKWNASSGWVDGSLLINSGATFAVNMAPLASDATETGKTLEFEFSTRGVEDDNAVICDLTTDGTGILITASEARLTSAAGETVSRRFKAGEVNRIAFVINRKSGVTYKGLAFIYINGILSGAVNYGNADSFMSGKSLSFAGSSNAQIELRSFRFYDTALSAENILNNYILYRSSLEEMMEVYYRNDVYAEGTENFSPEMMLHRVPVMVITGDIPTLEAATSTSAQILVDIEYTDEQHPDKSFKMKNAALRIQGTSSLAYPRKNFRFYTQKEESTVVYDASGNIIQDKLYSFKDGAQPVNCWCLKADFAESSGTHNTGIARIWNKAMFGAVIQHRNILGEETDGYALRTQAQSKALESGYPYDVRTTIDGFPIVLFYKKNASDTDLIFLGKYNFNNDKSTPSVFGFENIPGFDNSRMQCWETKDNGHPLGLFTDVSSFDEKWSEAFESRYPDTKTPNTDDLKEFSLWINGVSQDAFATEKWSHFDVYKVAAYYCYLMRFGAVDQPVKNAFLTSEDGMRFFFLNYDNDTINGLINTGRLALSPTVNRDTIGADGEYVYAGHNSVLWNKLTSDSEFMEIVSVVDNALYSAGLRYDEVISMFNEQQADKWVERVYNQDAEYKYLLPYVNQSTNNLFMLQGARSSHRSWWLSKRFSLYDSLFLSGTYRDRNISFKCLNDTEPGQKFTIKAATQMNYGYGVNNGVRETGVALDVDGTHTFTTTETLNLGDVVKVFGSANISSLDLSMMADRLAVLDFTSASDPSLGSKLKELILGRYGYQSPMNTALESISGIAKLASLQTLNIEGYQNIKSLDLTAQKDFRSLKAVGSGLVSVDFAAGSPLKELGLPQTIASLVFNQHPELDKSMFYIVSHFNNNYRNIHTISVHGCPKLTNDFSFIQKWLSEKSAVDPSCTLVMDGVDWDTTCEEFLAFSQHKSAGMKIDLRGKVNLSSINLDQANSLMDIWGEDIFDKGVKFQVTAPDSLFINPSEATIDEGESVKFSCVLITSSEGTLSYDIVNGNRPGLSMDEKSGLLTTEENGQGDSVLHVRATYTSAEGTKSHDTATVNVRNRIYPTSSGINISGQTTVGKDEMYTWSTSEEGINGSMEAEWTLNGEAVDGGYISIGGSDFQSCTVRFHKAAEMGQASTALLTLNLKKKQDGSVVATKSMTLGVIVLNYPTAENTTINGSARVEGDNPVYTWESSAEGEIGPMSVSWSIDESLVPYYDIMTESWDREDPLHGSVTLSRVMDVDAYAIGYIHLTVMRTNTGESFVVSKKLTVLGPNVIMTEDTNPAVLSVMYNNGLCASSLYMTKQEAEAVSDGAFNPSGTQAGSIFYNNTDITSFNEFVYFTGMTTLDAYAFYGCTKMASLKVPSNVTNFGTYCCYRGSSSYVALTVDNLDVKTLASYSFKANTSTIGSQGSIQINKVNWRCEQACSTSRMQTLYNANIIELNVYALSEGLKSTSSTYQHFGYACLHKVTINDSITAIPQYAFCASKIYGLELQDSVTAIGQYAFYVANTTGFNVNRMSSSVSVMGAKAFYYPVFKTDVDFRNLGLEDSSQILCAIYEGKLDLSTNDLGGDTMYLVQMLDSFISCAELVLPYRPMDYAGISSSGKVARLTVPSMPNYCASTFDSNGSPATFAQAIYTPDPTSGEYVQVTEFNPGRWSVYSVPSYAFYGCKAVTGYDATSVKDHNTYSFYGSGIKTLKLNNAGGEGTIAAYAFAACESLESIHDNSTQPWAMLNNLAFVGVNAHVTISSNLFGLYKQSTGFVLSPMGSDMIYALPFGNYTFEAVPGSAFGDGTSSKMLALGFTGAVEDLTERLKIEYLTLVISSNRPEAQFKLNYTASDGTVKEETVLPGSHLLKVSKGSNVVVSPGTRYNGWTTPSTVTVTMSEGINSRVMDYTEETLVLIAHNDGSMYSVEEWSASGYSNSDAEGVCLMRAESGSFIIAKEDAANGRVAWGGYGKLVSGISTQSNKSQAILDLDGFSNTPKIIEQCSGYSGQGVSGAPAAEACAAYVFPSGTNGYLPALGEWNLAYSNKAAVAAAMSQIGGTSLTEQMYWSSTQASETNSWGIDWRYGSMSSGGKDSYSRYVRSFSAFGILRISSSIRTSFTVSYTDIYGDAATKEVVSGEASLNVKAGTHVTVTPHAVGNITAEPQTFTWQGFTHECSFVLAKDAGVYIQHVNGSLHTESEWAAGGYANSDANGVAILGSDAAFVIAKQDASSSALIWGGYNKIIADIVTTTNNAAALLDFDGVWNTPKIIEQLNGYNDDYVTGAPAAESCANYTFPNGKKGYLPAFGEWKAAYDNKSAVVSAMSLIGGTAISNQCYWSSTQYDSLLCWSLKWDYGNKYRFEKYNPYYVRAFAAL